MPDPWPPSNALPYPAAESDADSVPAAGERWGWLELFLAVQLLSGALFFVPGTQAFRAYIRALPYVASLGTLIFYMRRSTGEPLPPSCPWLMAVFGLLGLNLIHADTQLMAGVAQWVFQISIAAPAFWVARAVRSEERLARLLWVIFGASFLSAAFGVLQVYYPDRFLPPEFSVLARSLNPSLVDALTYVGADGRRITRPPGLSDLPGGAAIAGLTTMVLGVALAVHGHRSRLVRALCFGAAGIGMTTLYLTQVRSLSVMAVLSVLIFAAVRLRQGRVVQGGWIAAGGLGLGVAAFLWAAAVGGEAIQERFSGLLNTGFFASYQESRGAFLTYTLSELLYDYPLGAGLGRWGMMQVYFGDPSMWQAPPIHVEIQITGWLLDGGLPMWLLYGGAVLAALRHGYRTAVYAASDSLQYLATIVLSIQLAIVGLCFAGPVFNTQLGIEFWTVTAALGGVVQAWREPGEAELEGWSRD